MSTPFLGRELTFRKASRAREAIAPVIPLAGPRSFDGETAYLVLPIMKLHGVAAAASLRALWTFWARTH
jgi:hypothetical protein